MVLKNKKNNIAAKPKTITTTIGCSKHMIFYLKTSLAALECDTLSFHIVGFNGSCCELRLHGGDDRSGGEMRILKCLAV